MQKNANMIHLYFFFLTNVTFFSCSIALTGKWHPKIVFSRETLGTDRLSTGNSILLLPLISENEFDTNTALLPQIQRKTLLKYQEGIKIFTKESFEKIFQTPEEQQLLTNFYSQLFKNEILVLASLDTIWKQLPSRYLMVIRIIKGSRISSFEGKLKRKAFMEMELWDARYREIACRVHSQGFEMNEEISDIKFLAKGLESIFTILPHFFPEANTENW